MRTDEHPFLICRRADFPGLRRRASREPWASMRSDAFYEKYLGQMTPDGVTSAAPMYAFARLGSGNDRPQKTAYADVLEFTGIDRRYYNNPKLKLTVGTRHLDISRFSTRSAPSPAPACRVTCNRPVKRRWRSCFPVGPILRPLIITPMSRG